MSPINSLLRQLFGSLTCVLALSGLLLSSTLAQETANPAKNKVSQTIDRLHVDPGSSASVGPADAPVTLIEFVDYECGFCAKAHITVEKLRAKYPDKLRIVYKHHPLSFHKAAPLASRAALAADIQGKFDDMHGILLQNRKKLKRHDLLLYATQLQLDLNDFRSLIDSEALKEIVDDDTALAKKIGATGTPFFLVNGRPLSGAQPTRIFERVIEEELSGDLLPTRWIEKWVRPPKKEHVHGPNCKHGKSGSGVEAELAKQFTTLTRELTQLRLELRNLRREVVALRREINSSETAVSEAELTQLRQAFQNLTPAQRKQIQAALNDGD